MVRFYVEGGSLKSSPLPALAVRWDRGPNAGLYRRLDVHSHLLKQARAAAELPFAGSAPTTDLSPDRSVGRKRRR